MKNKLFVMLLFAALMLVIAPATAQANGTYEGLTITGGELGVDYTYEQGSKLIIRSGTPMTLSGSTKTMGIAIYTNVAANLTLQDAAIDATNAGGAMHLFTGTSLTLTVLGNNTLLSKTNYGGIEVASGNKLVITEASTGTLNVTGGYDGAGIGGGNGRSAGDITIWNGTINATGSNDGAGIGDGKDGSGGGNITIYGGTIKARSVDGAGIGGGQGSSGGKIIIYDGVVEAKSTGWGAGIGSGWFNRGDITIDIKGGTVKAIAEEGGAGIGGGSGQDAGKITISGGTVEAVSNYGGAGIGGGVYYGNGGTVRITGGVVFANSLRGPKDIGSGAPDEDEVLSDGTLEISGSAALFLKHDTCPPPTTSTHTHINVSGHTANASVYGYPVAWSGNFGAYLFLYPLSYDLGGGAASPANPPYYGPQCSSFTLVNPTKTGYTFTGWTGTEIAEPSFSVNISPSFTGARDYTANWRPNTYTVNYHANGGTGSTASGSHTYDEANVLTANGFTRIGYTFAGWATSASGAVKYNDGQSVQNVTAVDGATVTLYANWTPNTYTVSYDANGGEGSTGLSSHTYDTAKALTANDYTKTGYTFAGWANSAEGAIAYSNGQSVLNLTSENGGSVTLFAKWTPNNYTVSYDPNGGVGSTASGSHTYDAAQTLTLNGFTRTGYTFAGWATSAQGTVAYTDGQSVSNLTEVAGGTVTLYAKWVPHTYTVSYDPNGGTGSTEPSSHTYDEPKALTANGFTKTGYTFAGWANSEEGAVAYGDGQSVSNLTSENGGTETLFAKWTPNTYTISYDSNGGAGSTASSGHTYDAAQTLTVNGFTRTGYTFSGWALSAQGSAVYTDGQNVSNFTDVPGETVTLYAKWMPHTYTVSYDPNGGMGTTAASWHTYDVEQALTPNGFRRNDYSFSGWALSAKGEIVYRNNQLVSNLTPEDGGSVTLFAVWNRSTKPTNRGTVVNCATGVDVHSGPGTNYPAIGFARKGAMYLISGQTGLWYKINFGGKVGYISVSYMASSLTTPPQPAVPDKEYGHGLVVNCNSSVNVRSGPGTQYAAIGAAPKGATYKVTGQYGSWYIIAFGDKTGYISAGYFSVISSSADAPVSPTLGYSELGTIINCNNSVNVRSGPGTNYSIIGSAPRGASYKTNGTTGAWYKIEFNGKTAYISASYFRRVSYE